MSITVACPSCNSRINAPDNAAGRTVTCPKCKGKLTIAFPHPEPIVTLAESPAEFDFNSKSSGSPRYHPRRSSSWGLVVGIGTLVLIVAGAGFAYHKYREHEKFTQYLQDGDYIDYEGAKDLLGLAENFYDTAVTNKSLDLDVEKYRAKREQRRKEFKQITEKIQQRWG